MAIHSARAGEIPEVSLVVVPVVVVDFLEAVEEDRLGVRTLFVVVKSPSSAKLASVPFLALRASKNVENVVVVVVVLVLVLVVSGQGGTKEWTPDRRRSVAVIVVVVTRDIVFMMVVNNTVSYCTFLSLFLSFFDCF